MGRYEYGYYLSAWNVQHGDPDALFEYYTLFELSELEARIEELMNEDHRPRPFLEEDIHVVIGTELKVTVEKEVVRGVKVWKPSTGGM